MFYKTAKTLVFKWLYLLKFVNEKIGNTGKKPKKGVWKLTIFNKNGQGMFLLI
jgi:hypothetical protein